MDKPVIATTLSGLYVSPTPWKKAHELWFEQRAIELNDPTVRDFAFKQDYFSHVDEVMQRRNPHMPEDQRTIKARELFFDAVLTYTETHPEVVNRQVIELFSSLKPDHSIGLITTNTPSALEKLLCRFGMQDFFDVVETSRPTEKDDKIVVFARFVERHGKPTLYVGGDREGSYAFCHDADIPYVYANLYNGQSLPEVPTVRSVEELREFVRR